MEVIEFILIVVFCIVSVFEAVAAGYKDDKCDTDFIKMIFFWIITIFCVGSILDETCKLRDRDVFNGEAEYVETIHISKGDTIKTYHIQPKR